MASPQYSTPYSMLSYPSYTPVSVVPAKVDRDSSAYSRGSAGPDLSLLRAAVQSDVAQQHHTAPLLAGSAAWPAPSVAVAARTRMHASPSAAPPATRVNAPLYAPPQAVKAALRPPGDALPYYSDIFGVRTAASAVSPVAHGSTGVEADVQSDFVSVSQAAPNLCAFQQECHSLLAMLNASAATGRSAPRLAQPAQAAVEVPAAQLSRCSPSPPPTVVSPTSSALSTERRCAAAAAPAHSTTFAQLMREMDDLASVLHGSNYVDAAPTAQPAAPASVSSTIGDDRGTPEKLQRPRREAPRRPGASLLLAPTTAELVHAPAGPFWAAQLLKWIVYLVKRRRCALERVQAFQEARTPARREAAGSDVNASAAGESPGAAADTPAAPSYAGLRVTDGLLRLLRSLNPSESDVNSWTPTQQRQVCTRAANLLAEMTATEEGVVADLLNDAAAVATLEREGLAVEAAASPAEAPASASDAYQRDMETIALLEQLTQENASLRASLEKANGQVAKLREEARRERASKAELGQHYDHMAAETAKLAAQLQESQTRLRQAEAQTKPLPQEEVLRNQLDRQTLHLRDVRAELDDVKDESETLRRTVLQLRDALVRHRAVIDLLTRRRRERERATAAAARRSGSPGACSPGLESPPMKLIEAILSGACDPPSTGSSHPSRSSSSSPTNTETEDVSGSCGEDGRGLSTPPRLRR